MKGIIFNVTEKAVTELLGEDAWDDLLDDAGLDGDYTALGTYADEDLLALVSAAATKTGHDPCLLYTSPSPRDGLLSRMPSSA